MKKTIVINSLILFLILFFLEFIVRFFDFASVVGTSKNLVDINEELNFNNRNVEATTFGKKVFTDNNGFRIPFFNYNYNNNFPSILILGDSTTFGVGVEEKSSFVGNLRNYKRNINFYNASVVGHSLSDYEPVINKFKDLRFEKILVFLNINDIHFVSAISTTSKKEKFKKNSYLSFVEKIKKYRIFGEINVFFRSKSALYMFVKSILSKPQERHFKYVYPYYSYEKNLLDYKSYLIQIKNLSLKMEKEIFFFIFPYEYQTRKEYCKESESVNLYLLPQREIKKSLEEIKLNYYDFTQKFCDFDKPKKLFLPFDPTHLSKEGHEFTYNILKENLQIYKFK